MNWDTRPISRSWWCACTAGCSQVPCALQGLKAAARGGGSICRDPNWLSIPLLVHQVPDDFVGLKTVLLHQGGPSPSLVANGSAASFFIFVRPRYHGSQSPRFDCGFEKICIQILVGMVPRDRTLAHSSPVSSINRTGRSEPITVATFSGHILKSFPLKCIALVWQRLQLVGGMIAT